jgi:GNAT superfamily N-acetyltransferase
VSGEPGVPVTIRPAEPGDRERILHLLSVSHGWETDDRFRTYFQWKHETPPLGSPSWLAFEDDELVGYRSFLTWEFEHAGGATIAAARAVDVATLPRAQGRGVFGELMKHAVNELRAAGTELIFTTPNQRAARGWLRAGALELGRLPVFVRPHSLSAVLRMIRSRAAADRWPVPCSAGRPSADALADTELPELLTRLPPAQSIRTRRTVDFLQWRYGFEALGYRVITVDDDVRQGLAVFRLRHRGGAIEAAVCDVLVPDGNSRSSVELARRVVRECGADYAIRSGRAPVVDRAGFVPLPKQGPVLYALPLKRGLDVGSLDRWDLCLGDVELL